MIQTVEKDVNINNIFKCPIAWGSAPVDRAFDLGFIPSGDIEVTHDDKCIHTKTIQNNNIALL